MNTFKPRHTHSVFQLHFCAYPCGPTSGRIHTRYNVRLLWGTRLFSCMSCDHYNHPVYTFKTRRTFSLSLLPSPAHVWGLPSGLEAVHKESDRAAGSAGHAPRCEHRLHFVPLPVASAFRVLSKWGGGETGSVVTRTKSHNWKEEPSPHSHGGLLPNPRPPAQIST